MAQKAKNDLNNFKGIYYNDNKNEKKPQYEFGAHFGYQDMCKRLDNLLTTLSPDRRGIHTNIANNNKNNNQSNPHEITLKIRSLQGKAKINLLHNIIYFLIFKV